MITQSVQQPTGMIANLRRAIAEFIYPESIELRDMAVRMANVDELTGCANRRAFNLAMPAVATDAQTCVILFDANNFGLVNKLINHTAGDAILCRMAKAMKDVAARYNLAQRVFRIGGDEFAVLAPVQVADEVRTAIEKEVGTVVLRDDVHVSISGTIGKTVEDADALLQTRKRKMKHGNVLQTV